MREKGDMCIYMGARAHTHTHEYKKGGTAGGKRIGGTRRELARISTIYTHVGGTAVAVVAVAVAISSIFRFSPFPGSLPSSTDLPLRAPFPCLPTTPGETARRALAVVLSDRA